MIKNANQQILYLNVVGEPVEARVRVFHGEEHISSWNNPTLWNGFDPNGKATIVFLPWENELLSGHTSSSLPVWHWLDAEHLLLPPGSSSSPPHQTQPVWSASGRRAWLPESSPQWPQDLQRTHRVTRPSAQSEDPAGSLWREDWLVTQQMYLIRQLYFEQDSNIFDWV